MVLRPARLSSNRVSAVGFSRCQLFHLVPPFWAPDMPRDREQFSGMAVNDVSFRCRYYAVNSIHTERVAYFN